jgi:nicotinamide-nucleotide amidase
MEQEIRNRLGILIYGVDDETLHGNIVKELERLNLTLSVAETFTVGIISQKLASTNSPSFAQGVALPLDSSQIRFLKMAEEEFNFLNKEPKKLTDLLATKARDEFKTDFGLAMFGKVLEEQEKGNYKIETFYSLSTQSEVENQEYALGGELWMVRERASILALDMLRKYLIKKSV